MLTDKEREGLVQKAEFGARVRQWANNPVFDELMKQADELTGKTHKHWALQATEEEAEKLRQEARGVYKFLGLINKAMLEGDSARRTLTMEAQAEVSEIIDSLPEGNKEK